MNDTTTKSFDQSYNCHAAVDSHCHVIVGTRVSQETNDKGELKPVVERLKTNLNRPKPGRIITDSGYFSEDNVNLSGAGADRSICSHRAHQARVSTVTCASGTNSKGCQPEGTDEANTSNDQRPDDFSGRLLTSEVFFSPKISPGALNARQQGSFEGITSHTGTLFYRNLPGRTRNEAV